MKNRSSNISIYLCSALTLIYSGYLYPALECALAVPHPDQEQLSFGLSIDSHTPTKLSFIDQPSAFVAHEESALPVTKHDVDTVTHFLPRYAPAAERLVSLIQKLQEGDSVCGDHFTLSDNNIIKHLARAARKRVFVSLNLSKQRPENKASGSVLLQAGAHIQYLDNVHTKTWLISHNNQTTVISGSANASKSAYRNIESLYVTTDPNLYAQLKSLHDKPPKSLTKQQRTTLLPVLLTPRKSTACHSHEIDVNESRIKRIQTAIIAKQNNPKQNVSLSLISMNCNHSPTLTALATAAQSGVHVTLCLDRDSLTTQENHNALQVCHDSGVHTFIYNPSRLRSNIMHSKGLLRQIGNEFLLESYTGNITRQGADERNIAITDPNPSFDCVFEFINHVNEIKLLSTPLAGISREEILHAQQKRKKSQPHNTPGKENIGSEQPESDQTPDQPVLKKAKPALESPQNKKISKKLFCTP